MKYYIGLDVHQRTINAAVLDGRGAVCDEVRMRNAPVELGTALAPYPAGQTYVVIEASSSFLPIYEQLEEAGYHVVVAHPPRLKAIAHAKVKNDRIDALLLAKLLRADLIPEAYVPPKEVRDLRRLVRHRAQLSQSQSDYKRRIRMLCQQERLRCPFTDVSGKKGRAFLKKHLRYAAWHQVLSYLRVIDCVRKEMDEVNKRMEQLPLFEDELRLLKSLPGIGTYTALLILSEIGEVARFPTAKQYARYAGLVPSTRASGEIVRHGRIIKQSSKWLRWAYVQIAWIAIRYSPALRARYQKLQKRRGGSKAIVGVAHAIARITYGMLKTGTPYREPCLAS